MGGILGAGSKYEKKFVNKTIDTNLSEDFRKHTQTEEVDGNLKNPLQIKAKTT